MPKTYEPIQTQTIGTAIATVTFSSIPQTYTDLILVANLIDSNGFSVMRFNSDSGNNYSRTWMYGSGTSALSSRGSNISGLDLKATTSGSEFSVDVVHLLNYSNTTTYKSCLIRQSLASQEVALYAGLWRNTSAISTITISNDIRIGSTFTLYGIKAA
jgi:hypothetical protein